jgi:hypothetical protein
MSTNAALTGAGVPGEGVAGPWSAGHLPATVAPHRNLLRYYLLSSLLAGPAFIIPATLFYFRFRTLRYEMDAEGITMRWGILFRREISLTYARIQDIQLTSNVVERWFGLARIQLQTASGSAAAEMTIEGVPDVDGVRDFLYSRMRGAATATLSGDASPHRVQPRALDDATGGGAQLPGRRSPHGHPASDAAGIAAVTTSIDAAAAELRALRQEIAAMRGGTHDG